MLDQNTDRMWYVIGAVIVGAAIIFLANGTLPSLFASVGDTFQNVLSDVIYDGPIDMRVDVGSKNHTGTIDIKVFADSDVPIASIDMLDGPEIVTSRQVLSFDGDESYLDMRHVFGNTPAFSIGAWTNDVEGNNFLINHDSGGGWSLIGMAGIKTAEGGSTWLHGDDNKVESIAGQNRTMHTMQVWDGSTLYQYVDGELVSTSEDISGTYELETLFIGARSNLLSDPVREPTGRSAGQMLEFYVYENRAMSHQEVKHLYSNGVSDSNQLVLHYDFVNGSGDTVRDLSGSGIHATNHGGQWIPMYEVTKNGTYVFRVTDEAGNVREESVTVRGL